MDKKILNLNKHRLIFPDWSYIYAGYGLKKRKERPITEHNDHVPFGIELRVFPPKIENTPFLFADKPWEHVLLCVYSTVFQDEGMLKLYYETFLPKEEKWTDASSHLCYAESKDNGYTWQKPNLGIVEFAGSKENNIIFSPEMNPLGVGLHGAHIFKDPNGKAEERYKLTYCGPGNKTYACYSADGLNWHPVEKPIIETEADSQNKIFWDSERKRYIAYCRYVFLERRGISYAETTDFWDWPKPEPLLLSDPTLLVDQDYYTNSFHIWPDTHLPKRAYLMMPSMYNRITDHLDTELLISRTGKQWFRPPQNKLILSEIDGQKEQGVNYFGCGYWKENPGYLTFICSILKNNHNSGYPFNEYLGGYYKAHYREDGFMGIRARAKGEFWTCKIKMDTDKIEINAQTYENGWIRVGLVDCLLNEPLPDCSVEDCIPLTGDLLWTPIQFKNAPELKYYDDVVFRFHVQLFRATLFGIRVSK